MSDDIGLKKAEHTELEDQSWDEFFEKFEQEFSMNEEEGSSSFFEELTGVSTLPHKKSICYGSCTISEAPRLVKCEDCGLVVKMVGFGHHRKVRHKDHVQKSSPSEDSGASDSEDDCQGFLLSPLHHHNIPSTSEGSILELNNEWASNKMIGIGSLQNTPKKVDCKRPFVYQHKQFAIQQPKYDIEKRNDLLLILKRTPNKPAYHPAKTSQQFEPNSIAQPVRKPKKPPLVKVFGSKKKRKGAGTKKALKQTTKFDGTELIDDDLLTLDDEQTINGQWQQHQLHPNELFINRQKQQEINLLHSSSDSNEFLDRNSFGDEEFPTTGQFVEPNSNSDDSIVTIPAQLTPGTSAISADWDPREAAERPTFAKGAKTVIKTVPTQVTRKTTRVPTVQVEQKHESNLDKVAKPSILKNSQISGVENRKTIEQRNHNYQPHPSAIHQSSSVLEQLFKYPGITVTTLKPNNASANITNTSSPRRIAPVNAAQLYGQSSQSLQQQFAAMQQQQQRRRMLTRDFDMPSRELFSEISDSNVDRNSRRTIQQKLAKPSELEADRQLSQPRSKTPSPDDSNHSSSNNSGEHPSHQVLNELREFDQRLDPEKKEKPILTTISFHQQKFTGAPSADLLYSNQQQNSTARLQDQHPPGQNIDSIEDRNSSCVTWRRNDSPNSMALQQQRKSSAANSPRPYVTASGTRFVPVDPRGLAILRKSSTSQKITNVAPTALSSPTASSTTVSANSSPSSSSNSQQPQYFDATSSTNGRKRQFEPPDQSPNSQQRPQQMVTPLVKRFRPIAPRQQSDQQQQQGIGTKYESSNFQRQSVAVNMDASPPTIIQHRQQQRPVFQQQKYIQQQQQFSILPPNAQLSPAVTVNSSKLLFQNRQSVVEQQALKRYPGNTQQLGPVFTVMQHPCKQQQPGQYPTMPQHPNGIIRTVAVNTSHLSNNTDYPVQSHFGAAPSFQQTQTLQYGYPYPHQSAPDAAQEFIIGSSPPPIDYFTRQMADPFAQVAASPMFAPGVYRFQSPMHGPMSSTIHRRVGPMVPMSSTVHPYAIGSPVFRRPPHPQSDGSNEHVSASPQYIARNIRIQSQQQIPAFLQPSSNNNMDMDFMQPLHQQAMFGINQQQNVNRIRNNEETADPYGIDQPPVLEAEGRLPSSAGQASQLMRTQVQSTAAANDEELSSNTRSSSASDLDLRDVLPQQNFFDAPATETTASRQLRIQQR